MQRRGMENTQRRAIWEGFPAESEGNGWKLACTTEIKLMCYLWNWITPSKREESAVEKRDNWLTEGLLKGPSIHTLSAQGSASPTTSLALHHLTLFCAPDTAMKLSSWNNTYCRPSLATSSHPRIQSTTDWIPQYGVPTVHKCCKNLSVNQFKMEPLVPTPPTTA